MTITSQEFEAYAARFRVSAEKFRQMAQGSIAEAFHLSMADDCEELARVADESAGELKQREAGDSK